MHSVDKMAAVLLKVEFLLIILKWTLNLHTTLLLLLKDIFGNVNKITSLVLLSHSTIMFVIYIYHNCEYPLFYT